MSRRRVQRFLLLLTLVLVALPAVARAAPEVSARLLADKVDMGRPFEVVVQVRHPIGSRVAWPDELGVGGELEEVERKVSQRNTDRQVESSLQLSLRAFDTEVSLPGLPITFTDASGQELVLTSPAVPIPINSYVSADVPRMRPVEAPVSVKIRDWGIVAMGAAVLALLSLAGVLWVILGRRGGAERGRAREGSELAPDIEALARLDALEASGALDTSELKATYLEMSEIFRHYLGRRFAFSSLDLTTSELRSRLTSVEGNEEWIESVNHWLSRCDLIKYANLPADPDEARDALYQVRRLIASTSAPAHYRPKEVARA